MSVHHRTTTLSTGELTYRVLKRRKQRTLTLSVHRESGVTVTMPHWVPLKQAERFVQEQDGFLAKHVHDVRAQQAAQRTLEAHYRTHRTAARNFVCKRLPELNQTYAYSYTRITIRCNKSRWGSCSSTGTLSFDYRILFLPPELQEYLMVHELCHLKEMNHSPKFWALVERTIPAYRKHRQALAAVARDGLILK